MIVTPTILIGDVRERLAELPERHFHCCVTSPPYWGLRDYGGWTSVVLWGAMDDFTMPRKHKDRWLIRMRWRASERGHVASPNGRSVFCAYGLEPTPEMFVSHTVEVFRAVRRVLRDDGTLWLNLGDSYASKPGGSNGYDDGRANRDERTSGGVPPGLKPKDLIGIPWRVALALQEPYYTGEIKSEADRIWLAAMVDAEGCIFIHKRKAGRDNGQGYKALKDSYGSGLEVSNTNRDIAERCLRIAGKGSICQQDAGKFGRKQTLYRWNLRSNECRKLLSELYPHLVAKQHEARLAIGCPVDGAKAVAAHESLKNLHQGGEPSVDFKPPPSMFEPGWYLRSDIIWHKCNPMPESCTDRPTKSHEHIFLLTKKPRYYYDAEAVKERDKGTDHNHRNVLEGPSLEPSNGLKSPHSGIRSATGRNGAGRNARDVWTIATQPYPEAHFATFPEAIPERCIKAGTSERGCCPECGAGWVRVVERGELQPDAHDGRISEVECDKRDTRDKGWSQEGGFGPNLVRPSHTTGWRPGCECNAEPVPCRVLDPFLGSGTTLAVAAKLGRTDTGIELSPEYAKLAETRIGKAVKGEAYRDESKIEDAPLFIGT